MYRCGEQGIIPSMNRSMSVPDTGSMWDMHTSASQPTGKHTGVFFCFFFVLAGYYIHLLVALTVVRVTFSKISLLIISVLGGEASLWDLTINSSTQGPTLEQLQKVSSAPSADRTALRAWVLT